MKYQLRRIYKLLKVVLLVVICLLSRIETGKSQTGSIKLIFRADDIASFHAANLACIKTYREGVSRSVEIMASCDWFPEAVKMLNENPGFDVGVHLMLTSEWDRIKWRPLTHAPSLVDKDGYFYPSVWGNANRKPINFLLGTNWKIEEVEQEFRAQIEMVRKNLPQVTHLTAHMGCTNMSKEVKAMVQKLAKEYKLGFEDDYALKDMPGYGNAVSTSDKIEAVIRSINALTPGTWVSVDHPGLEGAEMQTVTDNPADNLGKERQTVTDIWTNEKVKKALQEKGVELIGYKDIRTP